MTGRLSDAPWSTWLRKFLPILTCAAALVQVSNAQEATRDVVPVPVEPAVRAAIGIREQARVLCEQDRGEWWPDNPTTERIHAVPGHNVWIIVCAHDPGWSEGAWVAMGDEDGLERCARLPLHGNIVEGVESYPCADEGEWRIEIRHTTHMGTRTRSVFAVGTKGEKLRLLREWRRQGQAYPPDGYVRCRIFDREKGEAEP